MRRVTASGLKSAEPRAVQALTTSRLLDSGIPKVLGTRNYCPNLKELRLRIGAIKNIKKITASMKMIAASKLNRQQQNLFKTRPYAVSSQRWINNEWPNTEDEEATLPKDQKRLLIDITSDRGLCGSVNTGVVKASIAEYKKAPEQTSFFLIGEKSKAALQRDYGKAITNVVSEVGGNKKVTYTEVSQVADLISQQSFDTCTVLFTKFGSVLSSSVSKVTLPSPTAFLDPERYDTYEFEGDRDELLTDLWQFNMSNLLYTSLVESQTSELGARMTSMDSATKNASEVLNKLTLKYNRQRQAAITTELTEIVSGAAAISEQKQ